MTQKIIGELLRRFRELPQIAGLREAISSPEVKTYAIEGAVGSQIPFIAASLLDQTETKHLFILSEKTEAAYFYNDLQELLPKEQIYFLPSSFKKSYDFENINRQALLERTEVANKLLFEEGTRKIVVTYPEALFEKIISPRILEEQKISLKVGEKVDIDFLNEVLLEYGFTRVDFVYEPGEFAIRGGIIDIFTYGNEWPYRLELFDDELESIRIFDPESQLSRKKLTQLTIIPDVQKNVSTDHFSDFLELFGSDAIAWIQDTEMLSSSLSLGREKYEEFQTRLKIEQFEEEVLHFFDKDLDIDIEDFLGKLTDRVRILFGNKGVEKSDLDFSFSTSPQPSFNKNFTLLIEDIKEKNRKGTEVFLFTSNERQISRLQHIFDDLEADVVMQPVLVSLKEGFISGDIGAAIYTDHQIFQRYHRYKLRRGFEKEAALSMKFLRELQPGDYVTHIDHGVGRYSGLEKIELNGKTQESVRILYQNNDILYVGINSLYKIAKYVGKEGTAPKLNKLGSDTWKALKRKTKRKVKDIAAELIQLYAKRKQAEGFACAPDGYLQTELESSFFYEDTPDQLQATIDVKSDMEVPHPMDRLICGDVGFGKTEIAIRGAFKSVVNGKQVAILVPTTILALQHYKTFHDRLKDFGVTVDYLNRFRTTKEKTEIYKRLEAGEIDIIIGTHALLNKKIKFKDLGLLVIDEEQKFGVAAKEKIRGMKVNVDTLTLTATPIPRTLQFSLMSARDMSLLRTPPPNRQPIQTEIKVFEESLIKEAIFMEVDRGGQVFFVHNRVKNLADMEVLLKKICPGVDIATAHGQMDPKKLEKILVDFIDGKYDVLLATNIIETGLDIPNANTIIINNAHMFGLSDLHQLRGRVGRSNKKAFCYLFCPPMSTLTSEARKRLRTIEEFSDLGSGFNVAMRDLDIRGAGNILGGEQSGFVAEIGYETYQKILEEAIFELKNTDFKDIFQDDKNSNDKEYTREVLIESDEEMFIPDSYVNNIQERLNLYQKLDDITNEHDLEAYQKEVEDRFGPLPEVVQPLFDVLRMRWLGKKCGFEHIILKNDILRCYFVKDPKSSYYETPFFKNMLQQLTNGSQGSDVQLKQTKSLFFLRKEKITSSKEAFDFISGLYEQVKSSDYIVSS